MVSYIEFDKNPKEEYRQLIWCIGQYEVISLIEPKIAYVYFILNLLIITNG